MCRRTLDVSYEWLVLPRKNCMPFMLFVNYESYLTYTALARQASLI